MPVRGPGPVGVQPCCGPQQPLATCDPPGELGHFCPLLSQELALHDQKHRSTKPGRLLLPKHPMLCDPELPALAEYWQTRKVTQPPDEYGPERPFGPQAGLGQVSAAAAPG